ncbi:MAG TPA: DNA gyrase inhibitor YacG [Methylophilaceae bacterium]|jgi:endogenous inhibitor of DNA gyrase (YacG/DUF329 family)
MATEQKRLVACPQCKQLAEYSTSNRFRPFCSERCRMIDLGQWASESYRIPEQNREPDADLVDMPLKD